LDITGNFELEKRIGIDPDIKRSNENMDVTKINPQIGLNYSLAGIDNTGLIYSIAYYSGASSQNRQK